MSYGVLELLGIELISLRHDGGLRANDERRRTVPRRADDVKLADKYETHCESLLTNALTNATNGMLCIDRGG